LKLDTKVQTKKSYQQKEKGFRIYYRLNCYQEWNKLYLTWIATEPTSKEIIGLSIYMEREIFWTEQFMLP
jgi:hypothetical protein